MSLSPRQQRFVEEYLIDLNATQAAIRAGYSPRTANQQGSRLLANVKVQAAIAAAKESRSERVQVDQDRVLQEICAIAFLDPFDAFDDDGALLPKALIPESVRRAVVGIEVDEINLDGQKIGQTRKLRFAPKIQALTMLARHLGMAAATERHEHKLDDLSPEEVKARLAELFGSDRR